MRPVVLLFFLASHIPSSVSGRLWTRNDICPREIKATVPNGDRCDSPNGNLVTCDGSQEPYFGTMVSIHDALTHCPNISSLDLRVTLLGCSTWPDRWNFPLSYNERETYPALKKLRLEGYDFSSVKDVRPPWQAPLMARIPSGLIDWIRKGYWKPWLRAQVYGYPPSAPVKSNLDLWIQAMDWSQIEELAINDCRNAEAIAEKLPPRLTSLRKIESTDVNFIAALPNNTLSDLTWFGRHKAGDLGSILEHQGASLQRLEFRCNELSCPSMRNSFNMSILPQLAPNLVHISVNIPRNGTWPLEDLRALAALPKLRSLEIYSQLQSGCQRQRPEDYTRQMVEYLQKHGEDYCTGQDRLQQPTLNEDNAGDVWRYIKEANAGGQLQDLTLKVGDWSRSWDGPLYSPPWMESRQAEVLCAESNVDASGKPCKTQVSRGYWPSTTNQWESDSWMFDDSEYDLANSYEGNLDAQARPPA
ncbi:hypothetical protein E8E11_000571 [Didymella keratinophila]|nr:hypothetical protein E8E11_000571 [Didymella keratinophila]